MFAWPPFMLLAVVLSCVCVAQADTSTRWYALTLGDVPAGWRRDVETTTADHLTWETTEFLRINRGGQELEIEARTTWVTDLRGRPVEVRTLQLMGGTPAEARWVFSDAGIDITTSQGGRSNTVQVPLPAEPWLTPQAARTFMAQRIEAGAEQVDFGMMSPELGAMVVQQSMRRTGEIEVVWEGRTLPGSVWSVSTQGLPFMSEQVLSADTLPLAGSMKLPFGDLSFALAGPEVQHLDNARTPELFTSLFIKPRSMVEDPHAAPSLVLRLTAKDGTPVDLASAGAQRIAGRGPGHTTIHVQPSEPLPATAEELEDPAYRQPSSLIDSADPAVLDLKNKAVPQRDANWPRRAEAMRDFVRRWVRSKDLGTAFASASETAVSREGDCSEHAVLLAAMLRADGIPSRVATGLVWIDWADAFGWHMWTQALLDGRWVDLDATLPVPYTSGHVLVSTSALADGDGQGELVNLLGLLGNLDVDVVEPGP